MTDWLATQKFLGYLFRINGAFQRRQEMIETPNRQTTCFLWTLVDGISAAWAFFWNVNCSRRKVNLISNESYEFVSDIWSLNQIQTSCQSVRSNPELEQTECHQTWFCALLMAELRMCISIYYIILKAPVDNLYQKIYIWRLPPFEIRLFKEMF